MAVVSWPQIMWRHFALCTNTVSVRIELCGPGRVRTGARSATDASTFTGGACARASLTAKGRADRNMSFGGSGNVSSHPSRRSADSSPPVSARLRSHCGGVTDGDRHAGGPRRRQITPTNCVELPWRRCRRLATPRHLSQYTHTHTFNGPFPGLPRWAGTRKVKPEARDSEWQWHQPGRMQVCNSLQSDNHASTPLLSFLQAGCPSCRPTNSVKALKVVSVAIHRVNWRHRIYGHDTIAILWV